MADPSKSAKSAVSYNIMIAELSSRRILRFLQFAAYKRGCERAPSRISSVGDYDHFAIDDLIFGKKLRSGFRIDLDFRVREGLLDRADSRVLVGDGDKDEFPA